MKDDPFLNVEGVGETPLSPDSPSTKPKVIERTLMTMQKIRIYPDGQIFIAKTQSWFDKKGTVVKKKVKKRLGEYKKEKGVIEL